MASSGESTNAAKVKPAATVARRGQPCREQTPEDALRPFEATGSLTVDPPIPLANGDGNHDIYFQQRAVQYDVKCGEAQSAFTVVEKKRRGFHCSAYRRRVREAFRSALVMSATHEAANSRTRGQPFIRDVVRSRSYGLTKSSRGFAVTSRRLFCFVNRPTTV